MVKIKIDAVFDWDSPYEDQPTKYFDVNFEEEWLDDKMVQEFIEVVDKTKVLSSYALDSKALGIISPMFLSTGCKSLILLLKTDIKLNGDRLGDNCLPFLFKIEEIKDVEVSFSSLRIFPEPFSAYMIDTGEVVHSMHEFMRIRNSVYDEAYASGELLPPEAYYPDEFKELCEE